ncbi:hypothetical protein GO998_19830 (plasmid) [Ralstonia syzygii]|uniref:Uncharacterized protein n=1 Tax=Ralstonia syzygii TaxID=28097 RepID=A0ABX7ZKI7_9RALS|nr:hypothetical protein [Ralstonia syzygii]QUP55976.1 hypothetical protein GO998_19830 [Ralstonia syzygii]
MIGHLPGLDHDEGAAPPEAIVGAWKVDAHGNFIGEFMPNPKYQPDFSKANK